MKRLVIKLKERHFDGNYPIKVLNVIAELLRECDTLDIREGQNYVALSYMLKGTAKEQLQSAQSNFDEVYDRVTC